MAHTVRKDTEEGWVVSLERAKLLRESMRSAARHGQHNFFGAASSIQRDVAPTGDERYTRNPRPAFHLQLRCPKNSTGDEGTFSQRFFAKPRAAHLRTHLHESTGVVWHRSVQLPAIVIPSKASITDLFKGPLRDALQRWHHAPRRPVNNRRRRHTFTYGIDCAASAVIFKVSGSASPVIR